MSITLRELNRKRPIEAYPDSITDAAYLIAFNPEKLVWYGSNTKKAMYLSSSDVDLMENINVKKSGELASRIKEIVKNILDTPDCYLGDFKSGAYNGQPIRWNKNELLKGFKTVNNKRVDLDDCIKDTNSMTKIDIIEWIPEEGRYVEITNFFHISYNPSEIDMQEYMKSLKESAMENYKEKNYMKMVKRLLTYYMLKKNERMSQKLYQLIDSGKGIMYKAIADIKTLLYLLEHHKPPSNKVITHLDSVKYRLDNIYEFPFQEKKVDEVIERIKTTPSKHAMKELEALSEHLSTILNQQTIHYLKAMKLVPLKHSF